MAGRRKIITVLLVGAALCATVRADMVPLAPAGAVCLQPSPDRLPTDLPPASLSNEGVGPVGIADLGLLPAGFLPEAAGIEAGQASQTRPAQILTDRQNSLTLCLYALLGLGLCRSAPLVKKFHLSCIPDWYHSGAPSQIGHSFAISPDCLTSVPLACFIQPNREEAEKITVQYSSGAITALLRKSQFTPTALASRGPPYMS